MKPISDYQKDGAVPRIHGNGFIQLDLAPGRRLHVWGHRDIPRQSQWTGIHDHRFDFQSHVIVGRVFNIPYLEPKDAKNPQFRVYNPETRDGEDTVLVPAGYRTEVHYGPIQMIGYGGQYRVRAGDLHETVTDMPSATIMEKLSTFNPPSKVRVLVPVGYEPDNQFNRNEALHVNEIWGIIYQVVGTTREL